MKKILILTLVSLMLSATLMAGDYVDTQITFTYGDDNLFETSRRSPIAGFGERDDEMFNENLNTYKTGDETETMLVVYRKFQGYLPLLTVETAFVMQLKIFANETGRVGSKVWEDGSYIRVNYGTNSSKVVLTAFPYDSDRFLLGWTYDLSWGGKSFWPKSKINKSTPVPGLKLEWLKDKEMGVFLGFKTRNTNIELKEEDKDGNLITNDTIATTWAIMGGGFIDINKQVRFDLHLGSFYKGTNQLQGSTKAAEDNVFAKPIMANGAAFRLSFRDNFDMAVSRVMKVYRNDRRDDITIDKEVTTKQKENFGYIASFEGVYLTEPLRDADKVNSLKNFNAWAFDFKTKVYMGSTKLNFDVIMRNVQFLLFNVPGLTAYESITEHSEIKNELMISLGGETEIADHLTLGFLLGYKKPAAYKGEDTGYWLVIKDREDSSSFTGGLRKNKVKMPLDMDIKNIFSAKLSMIYALADGVNFTSEIFFVKDPNDTTLDETNVRVLRKTNEVNRLGFSFILQTKF